MPTILLFFGRPAVGKTTIIDHTFPEHYKVDVFLYVESYLKNGWITKDESLESCKKAYASFANFKCHHPVTIIAEFGTSCPELNVIKIKELIKKRKKILVFICEAPSTVCLKRIKSRSGMNNAQLRQKILQRNSIQDLAQQFGRANIPYHLLDMTKDLETNKKIILDRLSPL